MAASIPYLDAVIEETFRCQPIVPLNARDTVQEAVLLGQAIPKGTTVIFVTNEPSYTSPAFAIDNCVRSQYWQRQLGIRKQTEWAYENRDLLVYRPERWLKSRVTGKHLHLEEAWPEAELIFDPNAGPVNNFGFGRRACFGRKLAYVEIKLFLCLLCWKFWFRECPKEMSGYRASMKVVYEPQQCFIRLANVDEQTP